MKRVSNGLGLALCAGVLLATVGCDHIRDYSVNSYQGVLPAGDFRPAGSLPPPRMTAETPKPSVPTPAPEAAPAAPTTPAAPTDAPTKPAETPK